MPKIGMRIIKSAVAVFICFLIYFLRGGEGLPFYSAISAIICMQAGKSGTRKAALNRVAATFVGGIYGLAVLLLPRIMFGGISEFASLTVTSILIIPLIYTMVLLNYKAATSTCCIVFLSIAVNHAADVNPFIFTANRIVDTLIGVFVVIGVNAVTMHWHRNKDILFLCELEGGLLNAQKKMTEYTKVSMKELICEEANISFISKRTPGDLVSTLSGINMRLPVIAMNGAAIFDWNKREYLYYENIDVSVSRVISNLFEELGVNVFKHAIINDVVHIYYGDFKNTYEEKFYHEEKVVPMKNYIYGSVPEEIDIMYFTAVDDKDGIDKLYDSINNSSVRDGVKLIKYTYDGETYFLKVYSGGVSKEKALKKLKEYTGLDRSVVFQSDSSDITLIESADYVYTIGSMEGSIIENRLGHINKDDHVDVVRYIKKSFYSRRLR